MNINKYTISNGFCPVCDKAHGLLKLKKEEYATNAICLLCGYSPHKRSAALQSLYRNNKKITKRDFALSLHTTGLLQDMHSLNIYDKFKPYVWPRLFKTKGTVCNIPLYTTYTNAVGYMVATNKSIKIKQETPHLKSPVIKLFKDFKQSTVYICDNPYIAFRFKQRLLDIDNNDGVICLTGSSSVNLSYICQPTNVVLITYNKKKRNLIKYAIANDFKRAKLFNINLHTLNKGNVLSKILNEIYNKKERNLRE